MDEAVTKAVLGDAALASQVLRVGALRDAGKHGGKIETAAVECCLQDYNSRSRALRRAGPSPAPLGLRSPLGACARGAAPPEAANALDWRHSFIFGEGAL